MSKLHKFIEEISDDFQSTFSEIPQGLRNMMGFEGDFDSLTKIVQKYIPDAELVFKKTNMMGESEPYDVYFVTLKGEF